MSNNTNKEELRAVLKHLKKQSEIEARMYSIKAEIRTLEKRKNMFSEEMGEQEDIFAKLEARIRVRKEELEKLVEHSLAMDCYFVQLDPYEKRMVYMAHVENAPAAEIAYELCMSKATYFRKKKKVLEIMAKNMLKDGKLYDEHLTI